MSAAWQQVSRHLWPRGAGVSIVHCGVYRRTVVHNAVISARRAASSLVGMCAMSVETILGARTPTARRSAGWWGRPRRTGRPRVTRGYLVRV